MYATDARRAVDGGADGEFVVVTVGLDERCGDMTVGQEPLRMLECDWRRVAAASTYRRLGRRNRARTIPHSGGNSI